MQAMNEPNEAVEQAIAIWSLEAERDKLEEDRQRFKQSRQQQ